LEQASICVLRAVEIRAKTPYTITGLLRLEAFGDERLRAVT